MNIQTMQTQQDDAASNRASAIENTLAPEFTTNAQHSASRLRLHEMSRRFPPPISAQQLLNQCFGNLALVMALLEEFASSSDDQINELLRSVTACDLSAVAEFGHSLRGSASLLSAGRLHGVASDLETAAKAGDFVEVVKMTQELQDEMQRCVEEFAQLRDELHAIAGQSP